MSPLSLAIAGPVSDIIGIRTWYWLAGLLCLLMGIASFFAPLIMNVESNRNGRSEQSQPQAALSPTD
jgi:DHA3 family macrolide efflux protein-like MFS transporter